MLIININIIGISENIIGCKKFEYLGIKIDIKDGQQNYNLNSNGILWNRQISRKKLQNV